MTKVVWFAGCATAAVFLAASGAALAQRAGSGEIRLIVQGDDMGAAHGINVGTIQAYK